MKISFKDGRAHPACRGLGPEAPLACSHCSTGSLGGGGPGGGSYSVSPEMRNLCRRKWCLSAVALGANDTGWKGRDGPLHLQAGPRRGVPQARGQCWEGGPSRAGPTLRGCRVSSVAGGWDGLVGGHPGACMECPLVCIEHGPPAVGRAVFVAGRRPEGGQAAAPLLRLTPGSPCSLAS